MDAATLKARIDQALKEALLSRQSQRVETLRGVKSAILYVEVAENKRDVGLNDSEVQVVLAKEAKKRQESADLYIQGGSQEKADAELTEKAIIEEFLPEKISDDKLKQLIDETVANNLDLPMGQLIGLVKNQAGPGADGATIAQLVKQRMGL